MEDGATGRTSTAPRPARPRPPTPCSPAAAMRPPTLLRFARDAATGWPLRTALMVLAMSIGVAAVVVLTALGDGARRYVVE
jgi:hypothetical protein